MPASAVMAPANTVSRGWFMAIMAEMKKVLSPSSDTIMMLREATKACMKLMSRLLLLSVASEKIETEGMFVIRGDKRTHCYSLNN